MQYYMMDRDILMPLNLLDELEGLPELPIKYVAEKSIVTDPGALSTETMIAIKNVMMIY